MDQYCIYSIIYERIKCCEVKVDINQAVYVAPENLYFSSPGKTKF